MHELFYNHINIYHYTNVDLNYIKFFPSNLHLHLHNISFVNVFDTFIPVIMLKTLRFKSSVLFGTHTLLDKSFTVLQLPTHLSNLTGKG